MPSFEDLLKEVESQSEDNRLSCKKAHELTEKLGVSLLEVGKAADKLRIKIIQCQLGCF